MSSMSSNYQLHHMCINAMLSFQEKFSRGLSLYSCIFTSMGGEVIV